MLGAKAIMLCFDDFIEGMDDLGTKIQPLMNGRQERLLAAACGVVSQRLPKSRHPKGKYRRQRQQDDPDNI
jgi:hypothetical protein